MLYKKLKLLRITMFLRVKFIKKQPFLMFNLISFLQKLLQRYRNSFIYVMPRYRIIIINFIKKHFVEYFVNNDLVLPFPPKYI